MTQFSNSTQSVGTFTGLWTAGYQVSGDIYIERVWDANSSRLARVYSVTTILQSTLLNNTNTSTAGIVGLGGNSTFITQFVNDNNTFEFAIGVLKSNTSIGINLGQNGFSNAIPPTANQISTIPNNNVLVTSSQYDTSQGENFIYTLLAEDFTPAGYGLGFGVQNGTNTSWFYSNILTDSN